MRTKDRDGLHRRPNRPGGIWYFHYRGADGRWQEKSTSTANYGEARQKRITELEKISRGELPAELAKWTLEKAAAAWQAERRSLILPVTAKGDEWTLKPLLKALGGKKLGSIRASDVRAYQSARAAQVSARCVNREVQVLRVIKKRAEQLRDLAADIERLNSTPLPGSTNFLDLVREYGASNGDPEEEDIVQRFEGLPHLLERYAASLNGWPHPEYRKIFSDRNSARAYRVAQLCLYISALAGSPKYEAVDKLLESVRLFLHGERKLRLREDDDRRDIKSQFIGFKERNPVEYKRLEQKMEYIARR